MNAVAAPRPDALFAWRDAHRLLNVVGTDVRAFVAQQLGPLVVRIRELEAELGQLKAAPPLTWCDAYRGV